MQKSILFSLLLLPFILKAQADSIPIGKVTYSHQVRLSSDMDKNGVAELFFNRSRSVYIHRGNPDEKVDATNTGVGLAVRVVGGDKQGAPIYKMHAEHRLLYRDVCVGENVRCIVSDTFGDIAWALYPEHRRIGQYDCRRATGMYKGREYEAWYTLDIPISSGPYKLGGLPGLILEARTTDGTAEFLFVSIEIAQNMPEKIYPPFGKDSKMDYVAYNKAKRQFARNLVKEMRAQGHEISIKPSKEVLELWEADK